MLVIPESPKFIVILKYIYIKVIISIYIKKLKINKNLDACFGRSKYRIPQLN